MLPKVATQFLHHTSRAAAAVQNQTTQTLRNVLSSSGTSTSTGNFTPSWSNSGSSHWKNNGPGPGGQNYGSSRFNYGYTGAGRSVTQANVSTSHDTIVGQSDEQDEFYLPRVQPKSRRTRNRSHSLSLSTKEHHERGESLGVLRTVQLHHARSRHAFARTGETQASVEAPPPRPTVVRRNSTSAPASGTFDPLPVPSSRPAASTKSSSATDPATPQTTTPPFEDSENWAFYESLRDARNSRDPAKAAEAVRYFRTNVVKPNVASFNMALEALHETRRSGEPLTLILDTYNDMLRHNLLPNIKTYFVLILALTDRDNEVHKTLTQLQSRGKRIMFSGRNEVVIKQADEARAEQLRSENNFGSAMSLFEAILAINGNDRVPPAIYNSLLRSCAYHSSVEGAIHVWAQLEKRADVLPTTVIFTHMISTYVNVGDLEGSKAVFQEFLAASKNGRLAWVNGSDANNGESDLRQRSAAARSSQLQVWNKIIEAHFRCGLPEGAMSILEEMMDSKAGRNFGPADIPPPASSTFTQIISGFCQAGDTQTALSWFNRLLKQPEAASNPFQPTEEPPRPDQIAWIVMLDKLALDGNVEELNKLFLTLVQVAARDSLEVRYVDRMLVYHANMRHLETTTEAAQAVPILDFLSGCVLEDGMFNGVLHNMTLELIRVYIQHGELHKAVNLTEQHLHRLTQNPGEAETSYELDKPVQALNALFQIAFDRYGSVMVLSDALQLAQLMHKNWSHIPRVYAPYVLHSYGLAKTKGELPSITSRDWELLALAATSLELPINDMDTGIPPDVSGYAFKGAFSLLEDMANSQVDFEAIDKELLARIITLINSKHEEGQLEGVYARLGSSFQKAAGEPTKFGSRDLSSQDSSSEASSYSYSDSMPTSPGAGPEVILDVYHNRAVDEFYHANSNSNVHAAYTRFLHGLEKNLYPAPTTFAHLITTFGRQSDLEKVGYLYAVAQTVLSSLEHNKEFQAQSWFIVEDAMIIALAHAGDLESAHIHRARILEQGGSPSSDAYGALIQYVKDTTDDTSNAMALFQESQARGVKANIYLYNNIISKLAKARKADYALELFQQMKAGGVQPSSITYGALIAACARVGDHMSAETLFEEMTQQRNFRPRVPPYNTMMQLYTTTKPNRDRALHYFNALKVAGVAPTAHTYKLLIDAYGTIEPVDMAAMEGVFRQLEADPKVEIQGAHWAAVINAWGCVKKDFNKAIEIFESIAAHPQTRRSKTVLPDAVCYEAMINVLVMHRQTDLMPKYIDRLHASGVHMTAYIANFLIKGYAIIGDLTHAREVFESMADPPQGVAAPNNHVPHDGTLPSSPEPSSAVFREPSTWEAMVRAELGAGNREAAVALLDRLQARQYPGAVYSRIRGIMLDDSVSPWPSEVTATN